MAEEEEDQSSQSVKDVSGQYSLQFKAGIIKQFTSNWQNITSDNQILNMISGTEIEFGDGIPPVQTHVP